MRRELSLDSLAIERCPACGDARARDLGPLSYGPSPIEFSGERIDVSGLRPRLHACACGLRYTSPILSPSVTRDLYARSQPTRWADGGARFESTLRKAGVEIPRASDKVLDFGCFSGDLLDLFRQRGWQTFGVDLCRAAVDEANRRGHHARAGEHDAVAALPGPFQRIALFDVIEHLLDPTPLLAALRAGLAPGGELWILTGDAESWPSRLLGADWWYASFCEHVVFYSEATLSRALERAGLRLARVARLAYLEEPPVRTARNYVATGAYAALHRLARGRTRHRLGEGPPPRLPAVDHLFVTAVRA